MPKTLDAYRKKCHDSEDKDDSFPWLTCTIIAVIIVFVGHSCYDAHCSAAKEAPILAQQAKLCLAEFKAKSCDPLKTTN